MRVLFVTLPAWGHAAPLCSIAAELAGRGHEVAWVAHEGLAERLLPKGARLHRVAGAGSERAAPPRGRPSAVFRDYFDEVLVAATDLMVPAVDDAVAELRPDVVVTEQNCLAGSIGARRAGLPWVSVHVTPILLTRPWSVLPMLEAWVDDRLGQVQRAWGVEPLPWPLRSPHGTLIASSRAFLGPAADLREGDTLVGALVAHRHGEPTPAWPGPSPRILVTLGTLTGAAGRVFLERAARAAAELGSVLVLGEGPLELPPGARALRWASVPDLLAEVDLVVSHGGQNTVTEALWRGVPMVLAPIQFDQPVVAARVEALGAGRVVSWDRSTEGELREAFARVLADPGYREAARAIGATLSDLGGASLAADLVERSAR